MNQKKTLKKILDELNKESPRLDYIKGMLEVLIDENEEEVINPAIKAIIDSEIKAKGKEHINKILESFPLDEAAILDNKARKNLGTIKKLADESVQEN